MRPIPKMLLVLMLLVVIAFLAPPSSAQLITNHLVCLKIKDPIRPTAVYNAHLVPARLDDLFPCIIKVPAKMECQITAKTNVMPSPPGTGPTQDLLPVGILRFLCYKVKCPTPVGPDDVRKDQFGTRQLTLGPAKLLCAPASPSGAFVDGELDDH